MQKITAISLFCGVGGIDLGFKQAGVETIFANDFDKHACLTYSCNFSNKLVNDCIENIPLKNIPYADIVLFGFPCQAFSIAGYQKGFNDNRGNLFFNAVDVIKQVKPKVFFLENVKNLVSHNNGKTFETVKQTLVDLGYKIKYKVLNSCNYGNVPQNRERIYVVGFLDEIAYNLFSFPNKIQLTNTINKVINRSIKVDDKYYYNNSKYINQLTKEITNKQTVYQWRRVYVRENKNNLCPTLTANMGTGGHNVPLIIDDFGIRKLTPRECFLLQGFSKDFKLPNIANAHLYKQAGNSVTVTVIQQIAKNIVFALNNNNLNNNKAINTQLSLFKF